VTIMKIIDLKREIPLFDDPTVPEIDEIFFSVAWDLPGVQKPPHQSGLC
jgi:hypothetical protein